MTERHLLIILQAAPRGTESFPVIGIDGKEREGTCSHNSVYADSRNGEARKERRELLGNRLSDRRMRW